VFFSSSSSKSILSKTPEKSSVALDQNRDTIYHIENTLNEGGEIIKQDTIWH